VIIKGGNVALPGNTEFVRKDLHIKNGKIAKIKSPSQNGAYRQGEEFIDAADCWVLPGGIDPHVHFFDPGYTHKEDFTHGTAAAASGGITTVIDMPCTSVPPVSSAENLDIKLKAIENKAVTDFGFFGGISRQVFEAHGTSLLESLKGKVLGIKCYFVSGMENIWGALDHFRFSKVMEAALDIGVPVLLHAEDASYVLPATDAAHVKGNNPQEWYESRPEIAEAIAVENAVRIAEKTGGNLHIVHIGTAEAAAVLQARWRDPSEAVYQSGKSTQNSQEAIITGETCPHYLAFTLDDFISQGPVLKVAPPVKSKGNNKELWNYLANGTLSFIASDHAPGSPKEKSGSNIWDNSCGIAGTATLVPYAFSEGYLSGKITLPRFLQITSEAAAKRYQLWDRKGSIEQGKDADFVIIDMKRHWTVKGNAFLSKSNLTPFEKQTFHGLIKRTIVRGRTVYNCDKGGIVVPKGWGQFLLPSV